LLNQADSQSGGSGMFADLTSFVASRLVIRKDNQQEIITLIIVFSSLIRAELAAIRELLKRQDEVNRPEG
jgi:hypothetical protein